MIPISREAWAAVFNGIYKQTGTMVCNLEPAHCGVVVCAPTPPDVIALAEECLRNCPEHDARWILAAWLLRSSNCGVER